MVCPRFNLKHLILPLITSIENPFPFTFLIFFLFAFFTTLVAKFLALRGIKDHVADCTRSKVREHTPHFAWIRSSVQVNIGTRQPDLNRCFSTWPHGISVTFSCFLFRLHITYSSSTFSWRVTGDVIQCLHLAHVFFLRAHSTIVSLHRHAVNTSPPSEVSIVCLLFFFHCLGIQDSVRYNLILLLCSTVRYTRFGELDKKL